VRPVVTVAAERFAEPWQPVACGAAASAITQPSEKTLVPAGQPIRLRSTRYYVGVSKPETMTCAVSEVQLTALERYLTERVETIEGVAVAPGVHAGASVELEGLPGFFLESTVEELQAREDEVRASVAILLATYPGHEMLGILRGNATLTGMRLDESAHDRVIQVAVDSALRGLPEAIAASDRHAPRRAHVERTRARIARNSPQS
jgi:hypothetical protein